MPLKICCLLLFAVGAGVLMNQSQRVKSLSRTEAFELRGGQGPLWIVDIAAFCDSQPKCFTRACGSHTEQCSGLETLEIPNRNRNQCYSDLFGSGLVDCWATSDTEVCGQVTGKCEVKEVLPESFACLVSKPPGVYPQNQSVPVSCFTVPGFGGPPLP